MKTVRFCAKCGKRSDQVSGFTECDKCKQNLCPSCQGGSSNCKCTYQGRLVKVGTFRDD